MSSSEEVQDTFTEYANLMIGNNPEKRKREKRERLSSAVENEW